MMRVQQYLRSSFPGLLEAFGIESKKHPTLPLRIFNYGLETPPSLKTHPIVRECRSLVLEENSWEVVGRSFPRFYNLNEPSQENLPFDWSEPFTAQAKEDGSLMLLFQYRGRWMVTTRKSWADGIPGESPGTWSELFHQVLPEETYLGPRSNINPNATYVFEYCSPWTQVVHYHQEPKLFLLAAFFNQTGTEVDSFHLDSLAEDWGVSRPQEYEFESREAIGPWLEGVSNKFPTFEGLVLRDRDGNRLKVKSESYLRLHRLYNNGQVHTRKAVLGLMLNGEIDEALAYRPSLLPIYFELSRELYGLVGLLDAVWSYARGIQDQKVFALFVLEHCPKALACILFTARKSGRLPRQCLVEAEGRLLELVEGGNSGG